MSDLKKIEEEVRKARRAYLLEITDVCFEQALTNTRITREQYRDFDAEDLQEKRRLVGIEYCRLIRKLPTIKIEEILAGHEDGVLLRQENTIEEILSELADRILIKDEHAALN